MARLTTLFRREFGAYFRTPLAPVILILFLMLSGALTFQVGGLYERGRADLEPFFSFHPWLYLFFAPAIGMRLWAEEKRAGTLELLFTLPIRSIEAVAAKFLAGWAFLGLGLALTFPIWITVNYLGQPDNGVIAAGYLASFLMAGAYLAVAAAFSAMTASQVVAFVAAAAACFVLTAAGLPVVLAAFPDVLKPFVAALGVLGHYQAILHGVVTLKDAVYFGVLIGFWLFVCRAALRGGRLLTILSAAALTLGLLTVSDGWFGRAKLDLTAEKLYTLDPATRDLLGGLQADITVQYYFSEKTASAYPSVLAHGRRVRDLLKDYAAASHGKLIVKFIDPEPLTDEEDRATVAGVEPVTARDGARVFLGAVVSAPGAPVRSLPYLAPERAGGVEYDLTKAIAAVADAKKGRVVMLTSLPLRYGAGGPMAYAQGQSKSWAIWRALEQQYPMTMLTPDFTVLPDDMKLLILAAPGPLNDDQLKAIDQYVLKGGKLLLFADPLPEAALRLGIEPGLARLTPLLKAWGVSISPDHVEGDFERTMRVTMQTPDGGVRAVDWLPWGSFTKDDVNPKDPVSAGLKLVNFATYGVIDTVKGHKTKITGLVMTTQAAAPIPIEVLMRNADPDSLLRDAKPDGKNHAIAARIKGQAASAFADTPVREGKDIEVIVVADSDLLDDRYWMQQGQNGEGAQAAADNGALVLDAVENLAGVRSLGSLRAREIDPRPFKTVDEIRRSAESRWRAEAMRLQESVNTAEQRLQALQGQGGADKQAAVEIVKFKADLLTSRRALRNVQRQLVSDVMGLGRTLAVLNIVAVPALVGIAAIIVGRRRRRGS